MKTLNVAIPLSRDHRMGLTIRHEGMICCCCQVWKFFSEVELGESISFDIFGPQTMCDGELESGKEEGSPVLSRVFASGRYLRFR